MLTCQADANPSDVNFHWKKGNGSYDGEVSSDRLTSTITLGLMQVVLGTWHLVLDRHQHHDDAGELRHILLFCHQRHRTRGALRDRHPGNRGGSEHLRHQSDLDRGGDCGCIGCPGYRDHGGGDLQEKERSREMPPTNFSRQSAPAQGGDNHQPRSWVPAGPQVASQAWGACPRQRPYHLDRQRQ